VLPVFLPLTIRRAAWSPTVLVPCEMRNSKFYNKSRRRLILSYRKNDETIRRQRRRCRRHHRLVLRTQTATARIRYNATKYLT